MCATRGQVTKNSVPGVFLQTYLCTIQLTSLGGGLGSSLPSPSF